MVDKIVERYLSKIEDELDGLNANEKTSILTELEGHILDKAQEMAKAQALEKPTTEIYEEVIKKLGDPEKIGKGYMMIHEKPSLAKDIFVDHPAPSGFIFFILLVVFLAGVIGFIMIFYAAPALPTLEKFLLAIVIMVAVVICGFYMWPMYATYYTIAPDGIKVKYGPWENTYPWNDFEKAFLQHGMFSSRIGWPSVTPCVRLTDAVVFRRKKGWPLYVTPNDTREFLRKVRIFAEDLVREAII